jgi:hypothetical protein
MNQKVEYVDFKIRIKSAMKAIDHLDKNSDFKQAQEVAMQLAVDAKLLSLAYGSWTTGLNEMETLP